MNEHQKETSTYTIHTEFGTHIIEADDHGCFDGGILGLYRNGELVRAFKDWRQLSCSRPRPAQIKAPDSE